MARFIRNVVYRVPKAHKGSYSYTLHPKYFLVDKDPRNITKMTPLGIFTEKLDKDNQIDIGAISISKIVDNIVNLLDKKLFVDRKVISDDLYKVVFNEADAYYKEVLNNLKKDLEKYLASNFKYLKEYADSIFGDEEDRKKVVFRPSTMPDRLEVKKSN